MCNHRDIDIWSSSGIQVFVKQETSVSYLVINQKLTPKWASLKCGLFFPSEVYGGLFLVAKSHHFSAFWLRPSIVAKPLFCVHKTMLMDCILK